MIKIEALWRAPSRWMDGSQRTRVKRTARQVEGTQVEKVRHHSSSSSISD